MSFPWNRRSVLPWKTLQPQSAVGTTGRNRRSVLPWNRRSVLPWKTLQPQSAVGTTGMITSLDRPIMNQQAAVNLTPAGDSEKPKRLGVLAGLLMRRSEHIGLDDLEQAIENQQAAVNLTPAGDSEKPKRLGVLAGLLMRRFEHIGLDLEQAIENQQAAVDLTPAGDSEKPKRLGVLAGLLIRRFELTGKLDDLEQAIENQQAAVDLTPAGDSEKPKRLGVLAGLLMRRFERTGKLDDLDRAIKSQQAAVDLTLADDSEKLERLKELVTLLIHGFERTERLTYLDGAIKNQQAAVDLTPVGDPRKLGHLKELVKLLIRRFEREGGRADLDGAIKNQQTAVDLITAGDSRKLEHLKKLVKLLICRFEREGGLADLDGAIMNQQAAVDLIAAGDPDNPKRLRLLVELLMRRFEIIGALDDLDRAIWIHRTILVLTPAEDEYRPANLRYLENLLERRLQTAGDRSSEVGSSLRASVIVPTILGGAKNVYEAVKDKLLDDLQQLSICIKRSKHRELVTTIHHMEKAILCLKLQDGDKLCHDIFKASTRLGAYCQALRNLAGDETNQQELEDLYKEFLRIEREFSAAHDRINSKYEQLYKQWKAERQSISKFVSKSDPNMSQGDNKEVRALVEQVDAGFERMGTMLKSQAKYLKNFSETLSRLSRHPRLAHLSPDLPVVSGDPAQVLPQPPDSPSTPLDLSKQVDDSMEALSGLNALVEKSRYTKARMIISEKSSKTTQRLKRLRTSSEYYGQEVQSLSCLRTRRNDNSRDICNPQLELCSQLSNLVGGMHRILKATVKGFSGCKASIQGLVFRPLGDLICDLEPYLTRAGLEISNKGLHPDLILYDAAFQAIADAIPVHSKLLKDSLSVLDKLRGV